MRLTKEKMVRSKKGPQIHKALGPRILVLNYSPFKREIAAKNATFRRFPDRYCDTGIPAAAGHFTLNTIPVFGTSQQAGVTDQVQVTEILN